MVYARDYPEAAFMKAVKRRDSIEINFTLSHPVRIGVQVLAGTCNIAARWTIPRNVTEQSFGDTTAELNIRTESSDRNLFGFSFGLD